MFTDKSCPPVVVVVGSYGVGKSSFVRALGGQQEFKRPNDTNNDNNNNKNTNDTNNNDNNNDTSKNTNENGELAPSILRVRSNSQNLDGFDIRETESNGENNNDDESLVSPFSITIDNETIMIVDTLARDRVNVQQQMNDADLVLVVINACENKNIEEFDDYWIDQFSEISLQRPIIAVFNKIDKLSPTELTQLQTKFQKPTREHFVLETIVYVSAYTGDGINEVREQCIETLRDITECPRWVLIDPYTWKLKSSFDSALHRIFRLLDRDGDSVLNYNELEAFNRNILDEDFTPDEYNFFLQKLNQQSDKYVTTEGLTFEGFRHLMHRFAIAKKWIRCWDVLRHFHYQNDLTLHPRVFPQLPPIEADQTIELDACVFRLLERLFRQFADETISDDDTRSVASSMISNNHKPVQYNANHNKWLSQYSKFAHMQQGAAAFDDYDPGRVLTMDGIRELLSVLPQGVPNLHCSLLDGNVLDHFESAGRKLDRLTENGWLSFWAMYAVESPNFCFEQLTYLDLSTDADRSSWFRITNSKRIDHARDEINRNVIRALLFGGPGCGKTVFCDRLLCRIPLRNHSSFSHKRTTYFRAVSNRIGSSDEYFFLAITEVPAIKEFIEEAMDRYLPAYDMILLMFDNSQSRSFYELHKIFDRMPKNHSLPIQVIASKADLSHVTQYNQDDNGEKYNVLECLENWGLAPYGETWLTHKETSDFPALFDDLFFIGTNPHFRRLKQKPKEKGRDWKKLIKRTITITISMGVVVFGAIKLYQWWNGRYNNGPTKRKMAISLT